MAGYKKENNEKTCLKEKKIQSEETNLHMAENLKLPDQEFKWPMINLLRALMEK